MNPTERSCDTCDYVHVALDKYFCRRYPRTHGHGSVETWKEYWCGEWSPNAEEANSDLESLVETVVNETLKKLIPTGK